MTKLRTFLRNDDGLETVEYAIIAGLIVSAIVVLVFAIGNWVKNQFSNVKSEVGG